MTDEPTTDEPSPDEPSPMPVLLLHGALRGRLGLLPTMMYLRQHGLEARPFGYFTRKDALETHADRLEAFLEDWLGPTSPVPMLGLLTHSMGGLVARTYLSRPAAQRHASRIRMVMMAPPNQGSQIAHELQDWAVYQWVYGAASKELLPDRISNLPLPPPHCEVCILAGGRGREAGINPRLQGDDDGVVSVDETRLPGVEPHLVGGVHSFLQWRPSVLNLAVHFFQHGTLSPETDAEAHAAEDPQASAEQV